MARLSFFFLALFGNIWQKKCTHGHSQDLTVTLFDWSSGLRGDMSMDVHGHTDMVREIHGENISNRYNIRHTSPWDVLFVCCHSVELLRPVANLIALLM